MPHVWLNGSFVDDATANISHRDAGLLHAAGAFTTMRAADLAIFRLDAHLDRLAATCDALHLPTAWHDADAIAAAAGELLDRNELRSARLRLTITRGCPQAVGEAINFVPTVLLTAAPLVPYPAELYERGMTAVVVDDQKLNPYDVQAGHKTLNYFSRLAALRSANARAAGEALWFDMHNYLQSGSISNVFIVTGGTLITPPVNAELTDNSPHSRGCVLPGITRAAVIERAAAAGIAGQTKAIDINALLAADEVFVTNSMMGVMPVCRIERHAIGDDRPGPVTRQLMDAYKELVESR